MRCFMSRQPSFPIPATAQADETTGRYIITFRDEAVTEGLALLSDRAGIAGLANAAEFTESALDLGQLEAAGGAVFPTLGVAVVSMDEGALNSIMTAAGEDSAILAVEPERIFYAMADGLPPDYLRGYRDAVNHLYEKATAAELIEGEVGPEACFADNAQSTWGLKATKVVNSRYTGQGMRVAVLDTGMDLQHPDFRGRSIVSKSFVPGEAVQDGNSHGTHCIGTACGFKDLNGRRYGIAYGATIYVGKVLSNGGSGDGAWILAGMEWAIANRCQVISMSLGNTVPTPSTAYENVGRRALQNGCLIVAAAGNHGPRTVGQPANSPSIMAVAAVDNCQRIASFSSPSGGVSGANVDVAGPGVAVYSSVPVNKGRYAVFNGTSMATPHVAGIAALYAQARGARGSQLWQLLISSALRLPIPASSVGSGLAQAPQ
jgi:subtilisin